MNKYMSLESTIRSLGAKRASQPLEKDMNDQVHAGSYTSKNFEVSRAAQLLFANLPKNVDSDDAEKSLQLHDKLFDIHKKVKASGRASPADIDAARRLHDQILKIARDMGIEDKHGHVKDSLDFIKSNLDQDGAAKTDISPDDAAKKFATPPKDYQSDVKSDSDIDNMAKFHISRDKRAQRKLKIIDDEFKLGETPMSSISDALKQVLANEEELNEKKKMTKADIAALKEPKGEIDAGDLAALRAGEHKKKMKTEEKEESAAEEKAEKKHNNTPAGVECPVCGMKACPTVKEEAEELDELKGYQGKSGQKALYKLHTRAFKRLDKAIDAKDPKTTGRNARVMDMAYDRMKEEVEQTDEGVRSIARSSRTWADKKTSTDIAKKHSPKAYTPPGTPSKAEMRKTGEDALRRFIAKGRKITREEVENEVETLDEAQFLMIIKGSERKRIRNNPIEIARARKEGWAISEETVSEASALSALGTQQKKATIQREVQQKKAMYAKKDAVDKQKFSRSMQKIHAGDEVEMDKKNVFMERAIAILGEEYADLSFEELVLEAEKKARGRPRKHPPKDPNAPKRPRGRPKKGSSSPILAKGAPQKPADTDKDREHIVMGLRKAISLRGEHHVKFADGSSHKIPAEHAQRALKMHDSLSKPSEKMVFARKLAASHDSFKKALADKNPGGEEKKKTGITLAKRAD